jgi:hypothetical protein
MNSCRRSSHLELRRFPVIHPHRPDLPRKHSSEGCSTPTVPVPSPVLAGRITIGRDCKQLEWMTDNLIKENRKKLILDLSGVT